MWEHAFVEFSPNHLGCVAEMAIAFEAVKLGVEVYKPVSEHARADLIFGIGDHPYRIQCKSGRRKGDVIVVVLATSRHTPTNGYVRSKYTSDEIDFFAVHCRELDQNFLIPISLVDGHSGIHLRLQPAKNSQLAAIHSATDFILSGAVAQLGERRRGTPKAGGSSPPSSTPDQSAGSSAVVEVGADDFRRRFGWYMQRAAAGEEIRVSRRGKPYVRLLAA